jgi:glycosidase
VVLAAAFLFSYPGAPAIYYGDEVGLEGGEDPDCRRCFPWEELRLDHPLLSVFRKFARWRKEEEALVSGGLEFLWAFRRAFLLRRPRPFGALLLALNAGSEEVNLELPAGKFREKESGEPFSGTLRLPPYSFLLLKETP